MAQYLNPAGRGEWYMEKSTGDLCLLIADTVVLRVTSAGVIDFNTFNISDSLTFDDDSVPTARIISVDDQATAATAGNALAISAGAGLTSGTGGAVSVTAGAGGATGTGGAASLVGGAGGTAKAGGAVAVTGGAGTTTGAGGAIAVTGGAGGNDAVGGAVAVTAGAAGGGNRAGGAVAITAGLGKGTAAGGAVTATSGAGTAGTSGTAGASGAVTIAAGAPGTATTGTGGAGGTIAITGAAGGATSGAAGTGGAGSSVTITAGAGGADGEGGSGQGGAGGSIVLTPGAGGAGATAGASGNVQVAGGRGIVSNVSNGYVPMIVAAAQEALTTGSPAVSVAKHFTTLDATGGTVLSTLAAGNIVGQVKKILAINVDNTTDVDYTDGTGAAATATFDAVGECITLVYNGTGWVLIENINIVDASAGATIS